MFITPSIRVCLRCCGVLISLLCCTAAFADQAYSQGMEAYLKGDYAAAYDAWVKAAKQEDHRAMFNLGLLHQTEVLPNSDASKAKRWFNLAGQSGYAAADYHHAIWLIEQQADQSEVVKLLSRSAENGYHPAQQRLAKMQVSGSLSPSVANSSTAINQTDNDTLTPDYLDEAWIRERDSTAWTIQILAFADLKKVRDFIDTHNLHDRAAYFREIDDNEVLYKLVYGEFEQKQDADKAREKLKPALKAHGPWLRTISSVQSIIAQQ